MEAADTATESSVVSLTQSAAQEVKSMLQKPENAGKALRVYVEQGGVSVLVDPFSAQYVRGAVVDFSDSLTAGGFKISNPNALQSCGCGKSFTA